MKNYNVGIIGLGRMGGFFLNEFQKNPRWTVGAICDADASIHDELARRAPGARITDNEDDVFNLSLIHISRNNPLA